MAATVARQPAAAASMMARVDRLDLLLGYLEEMHRNGNGNASPNNNSATTASSSSPSTPAGGGGHLLGLVSSDDDDDDDDDSDSAASTPRGSKSKSKSRSRSKTFIVRRRPRPAKEVLEEAKAKGSLIDRIAFLEHRVLKNHRIPLNQPKSTENQSEERHVSIQIPCLLQMEADMEITPSADTDNYHVTSHYHQPRTMTSKDDDDLSSWSKKKTPTKKKKGLKSLVKSCVRGNLKTKA